MSIADQVDVEEALQRWGQLGPEEPHIYTSLGSWWHVLARRVFYARRYLVGVHDLNANRIVAVSMEKGPIRSVVRPAFLYIGPRHGVHEPNPNWTG